MKKPASNPAISLPADWLLLLFTLSAKQASQRVEIWRRLKRYGALPLRGSGYLLPQSAENQENFAWLAETVRKYKGEASVLHVAAIDDMPDKHLHDMFREARTQDYQSLIIEIRRIKQGPTGDSALARARKRCHDILEIDFFHSPLRDRAMGLLEQINQGRKQTEATTMPTVKKSEYAGRVWITRPQPKIDRVASAWLIRRFIDPRAKFIFAKDPAQHKDAVPFDMYQPGGFGHRGENCTFETLCADFGLRNKQVVAMAQAVHDEDLLDEKFGRTECMGINKVLKGWISQGVPDATLLDRGMELMEGLYHSIA